MSVLRTHSKRILFSLIPIILLGLSACRGAEPTPTEAPITVVAFFGTPEPTTTTIPPEDIAISFASDRRGCLQAGEGYEGLVLEGDGLCFIYPAYFEAVQELPEGAAAQVIGPGYTSDGKEARASLTINIEPLDGRALEDLVDELIEASPGENVFENSLQIDERPAVTFEGLPGDLSTRIALVAANERAYTLRLSPLGDVFPDAATEAETLWSIAVTSMRFFPPQIEVVEDDTPIDTSTWSEVAFAGSGISLLLPPEWEVVSTAEQAGLRPPAANSDLLTFRTLTDLPSEDATAMLNAITTRLMEAGANEPVIEPIVMNRIEGYSLRGDPEVCQTIYIPAFELVHEINVAQNACTPTGVPIPVVQTIVDSVRFSAP